MCAPRCPGGGGGGGRGRGHRRVSAPELQIPRLGQSPSRAVAAGVRARNRRGTEAPPGPLHQLHFFQVNPDAGTPGRGDTSHLLSSPLLLRLYCGSPPTRPRFSSWIDGKYLENSSIPDQTPTAKEFSVSALENGQEGRWEAGRSPDALRLHGHIPVSACPDSVFRPRCVCRPSPGQWRSQAVPHGRVAGRPPSGRLWGLGVRGPPDRGDRAHESAILGRPSRVFPQWPLRSACPCACVSSETPRVLLPGCQRDSHTGRNEPRSLSFDHALLGAAASAV